MRTPSIYGFILPLFLLSQVANAIIGGQSVDFESYRKLPVVGLIHKQYPGEKGLPCTAVILGKKTLLTAAHCVSAPINLVYRGVAINGRYADAEIRRSQIYVHPDYNQKTKLNDLAIIKLNSELFDMDGVVFPELSDATDYMDFLLLGYGEDLRQFSGVLRSVVKTRDEIRAPRKNMDHFIEFDQSNATGVCSGDSGGPVFGRSDDKLFLVAISSSATNLKNEKKCSYSGIAIKIDTALDWIKSYL